MLLRGTTNVCVVALYTLKKFFSISRQHIIKKCIKPNYILYPALKIEAPNQELIPLPKICSLLMPSTGASFWKSLT